MDTTIYVGLSHQMALRRHLDVIASNIANANTAGFQRENMQFENFVEHVEDAPVKAAKSVSFVLDYGVTRDATPGVLVQTGSSLDAAIVGVGYFNVQSSSGEVLYTRNGHFSPDAQGYLATSQGARLLDTAGKPILIDPTDANVAISGNGSIQTQGREIARVGMVRFANPQSLERVGDTMLRATPDSQPETMSEPKLRQGMLEQSNVNPIVEMTEMISVQRSYEATTRMLERYEDIRKRSIDRLSRVQ